MVGLGRLELPTSPLSGARSSHLSYRPIALADNAFPAPSTSVEIGSGIRLESGRKKTPAKSKRLTAVILSSASECA